MLILKAFPEHLHVFFSKSGFRGVKRLLPAPLPPPFPKAHKNITTESMLQFHNNLKCSFTNTRAKQVYHQEAVLYIFTVFEDTRSKNSTG